LLAPVTKIARLSTIEKRSDAAAFRTDLRRWIRLAGSPDKMLLQYSKRDRTSATISDSNTVKLNAAGIGRRSNVTWSTGHESTLTKRSQCKLQGDGVVVSEPIIVVPRMSKRC